MERQGGEGNDNIAGDKGSLNGDITVIIMDPEWDRKWQRMGLKWT
jgi:hypothetical protein